ncbi:MAG: hypothetical protein ABI726_05175 [bacterium]
MTFRDGFSYGSGDEFWMRGSWYLPDPDKVYWSRLMNLGHFEASGDPDNWVLGLFREDFEPNAVKLVARSYGSETGRSDLTPAIPIPTAQWFTIKVHAKLSPTDGQALTEVYKDGELVSTSTQRNMWQNSPLHFYTAGLSYFWPGNGNTTVYFDAPRLTW